MKYEDHNCHEVKPGATKVKSKKLSIFALAFQHY